MHMSALPAHMPVHRVHALCLRRSEDDITVTGGCELPGGHGELNPGLLNERPGLLTAESMPKPPHSIFLNKILVSGSL